MATRPSIRTGMRVVGLDGKEVGSIKEVRATDFRIDRRMSRDVYAPFSAIQDVSGDTVRLTIASDKVNDADWPKAPIIPTDRSRTDQPGPSAP